MNQDKSNRKDGVAQKLLLYFKKGLYRVLEKATPISYWIQRLTFCEGPGRPKRKVNESAFNIEKIPPAMILCKHVDGTDTQF